jgi:diacylglycerol kinase family enzyme
MFGKHTRLRAVRILRARQVAIASRSGTLHAQFDGELREVSGTMDIRIDAGALPVLIAE